jgi:glycosyltransferase involved in cell wall biosynthesis
VIRTLRGWVPTLDLLSCRVPTPAAWFAFREAERHRVPVFLLVVGDLRAVAPTLPYRGVKRALFAAYTNFEEWAIDRMTRSAITFTNGADLAAKHRAGSAHLVETKTTTIAADDVNTRTDVCEGSTIRILTVSRIDPRKSLGCLPDAVARLRARGHDVRLDIVGPVVGQPGEAESAAIIQAAERLGVGDRVRLLGAVPLDRLMPLYRSYDLFALPTGPGEGIPRVLLESMAAGVPVIATRVAGIPSLVTHEGNGLLIDASTGEVVAAAADRLIRDPALRRQLIQGGYETARAHTLEAQAARMMAELRSRLPALAARRRFASSCRR